MREGEPEYNVARMSNAESGSLTIFIGFDSVVAGQVLCMRNALGTKASFLPLISRKWPNSSPVGINSQPP